MIDRHHTIDVITDVDVSGCCGRLSSLIYEIVVSLWNAIQILFTHQASLCKKQFLNTLSNNGSTSCFAGEPRH